MTGQTSGSRAWRPSSRRSIVIAAVAAIVGIGAGLVVNALSPNPVYGIQIIADVVVIAFAVVVAVVPPLRWLLPAAIGLAVGVIAGVAIGMTVAKAPSLTTVGTVEIALAQPESMRMSAPATCLVTDGTLRVLMASDPAMLRLTDGRTLDLGIRPGEQEPIAPEQLLGIDIRLSGILADGSPTETRMVSDATSDVTLVNNGATGSMTFEALVLHDLSELREPVEFEGTLTWSCPSNP